MTLSPKELLMFILAKRFCRFMGTLEDKPIYEIFKREAQKYLPDYTASAIEELVEEIMESYP